MKKGSELTVINNNFFSKIISFFKKYFYIKRNTKKNTGNVEKKDKGKNIYIVEYDVDPTHTDYGDSYIGNTIIRNTPSVKKIVNPIEYSEGTWTPKDKKIIIEKYNNYLKNEIDENELSLDDICKMLQMTKEEINIRKKRMSS